jgi:hypothetical protein
VILSEGRQTHFAHVIIDGLYDDDLVDYSDDDAAMRAAKRAIQNFLKEEDNIDTMIRQKVMSLKKTVIEGSTEWDTMYSKYYEEELKKRGLK